MRDSQLTPSWASEMVSIGWRDQYLSLLVELVDDPGVRPLLFSAFAEPAPEELSGPGLGVEQSSVIRKLERKEAWHRLVRQHERRVLLRRERARLTGADDAGCQLVSYSTFFQLRTDHEEGRVPGHLADELRRRAATEVTEDTRVVEHDLTELR